MKLINADEIQFACSHDGDCWSSKCRECHYFTCSVVDIQEQPAVNTSPVHIILYPEDFDYDIWEEYCDICGEDASATSLTITFDQLTGVKARYD